MHVTGMKPIPVFQMTRNDNRTRRFPLHAYSPLFGISTRDRLGKVRHAFQATTVASERRVIHPYPDRILGLGRIAK